MKSIEIQYCFRLSDSSSEDFKLELNPRTLELVDNIPGSLPDWSKLNYNQCPHCPLDINTDPYCPLAANIVNIVNRFDGLISYDKIRVDVITQERRISAYNRPKSNEFDDGPGHSDLRLSSYCLF